MRAQHPGWTELGSCYPVLHWVIRLWKVALCGVNSISDMSDGSLSLLRVNFYDPTMAFCKHLPPHNSEGIWILSFWIFIFYFCLKDLFCLLKKAYALPSHWAKGPVCFRVLGRPRKLVCMVDSVLWASPFLKCIFCGFYRFSPPFFNIYICMGIMHFAGYKMHLPAYKIGHVQVCLANSILLV